LFNTIKYKDANVVYSQSGGGQTLVLLHGFLEDKSMWADCADELRSDFCVIAPDLLGLGETGNVGYVHSMEEMADAVYAVLEEEEVGNCTVVGHSMGGYVALALAEKYPEKVSALVLFHSTAYADSEERKKDRERVISLVQRSKSVYIKTVIPSLFADEWRKNSKTEIQDLIETANGYSNQGIIANIRGMMDRKSRAHVMADGNFAKLIIHGALDPIISTSDMETLADLNSNISLCVIKGVAHMGHFEAKDEVLSILKNFCKK
jgi:pimeloyl-ACP methyl ester carboxylesterase